MRFTAIATTALAATGLALTTVSPASAAAGLHHLMVNKPSSIRSIYISTVAPNGLNFTACRALPSGSGWVDGRQDLVNGKQATVISFASSDCSSGYGTSRTFTVPTNDGLDNYWLSVN